MIRIRQLKSVSPSAVLSFSATLSARRSQRLGLWLSAVTAVGGTWLLQDFDSAHCQELPPSLSPSAAAAEKPKAKPVSSAPGGDPSSSDPIKSLIHQFAPQLKQLGFSGAAGICCGIALKRIGKGVAVVLGIAFTGLQALSHLGYITIDYEKVASDCSQVVDVNADGVIDEKDALALYDRVLDFLSKNLPNAGGFASGFFIGAYYG